MNPFHDLSGVAARRRGHPRAALMLALGQAALCAALAFASPAGAADKPNFLVIWGDDIGIENISHNNRGAKEGWQKTDVTMATVLKRQGYATGQFGKNHEGDRDEHLPTMHGFDEFLGNLYHLNAEEEPENLDYPKNPEFRKKYGPRGVIHSKSDGNGGQTIEDTGPLTKKRMETIDDETVAAAKDFITQQVKAGKPFFVWWNGTRMHFRTHVKAEHRGLSGQDEYSDGMFEHDMHVGELLKLLDDLGIADNTIVQYSTDNGPHYNSWPDAGTTPFRSEKNTNWEGAYRVPFAIRWPGRSPAGETRNEISSHTDKVHPMRAAA